MLISFEKEWRGGLTHLLAVLALHTRPILRLRAVFRDVTDGVTVATDVHLLVGAIVLTMTSLATVEAWYLRLCEKLALVPSSVFG